MGLRILLAALTGAFVIYTFLKSKGGSRLPPGPRGKPVIGNLLDLPAAGKQEWQHWLKHKDLYGPLSSLSIFGTTLVIINDRKLAFEILEKRSAKHSSRPNLVFADEIVGWGKAPSSQDNTSLLRSYRKAMARIIGSRSSMAKFDDMLEVEARRFLWRVLDRPSDFVKHTRTAAGAFILKITYGYNIEPHHDDPLVNLADLALQQFSESVVPGAWLVDMIPALKHIPEWFPGAGFKKTARFYAHTLTRLVEEPFAFTKSEMADEKHENSFTASLLQQGEDEEIVKWSSVALYSAGADTTVSALKGFYLAMMLHPNVQQKAQAELDQVLGPNVFPSVEDRDKLPYINAIVTEALRWHTVAPLGLPHKTDQDDIVDGYLIPKGALLLPNIWAYNHDPEVYENPSVFDPERFLNNSNSNPVPDPSNVSFGFGRRICPGRLVADISLFLTIAHTLAVFNITKPLREDGRTAEPNVDFTPGIICHPEDFDCVFSPRSPEHKKLVVEFEKAHPFEKGDAPYLKEILTERKSYA
ncbi:uncharacterized protein N7506_007923 [Penicillium brevicompactum]|uniref:uncharacterized protein n=1 Tax=Penicillium brevicompactum TaxID=5074 RepID=UPI0025424D71|nr:uncharacterized protein N7506_007923 [Penicillium brevicompactum]KAJ5334140.1 hypothetical protein N7506_007923 [Penicillium brevicompactum]